MLSDAQSFNRLEYKLQTKETQETDGGKLRRPQESRVNSGGFYTLVQESLGMVYLHFTLRIGGRWRSVSL